MEQEAQYSAIAVPLNAAAKIIALNKGVPWSRTIIITDTISINEYHVGPSVCRLHPKTVVNGNIVKIIEKLFRLTADLEVVKKDHRTAALAEAQSVVKKQLSYIARVSKNGDFEHFLEEVYYARYERSTDAAMKVAMHSMEDSFEPMEDAPTEVEEAIAEGERSMALTLLIDTPQAFNMWRNV